MVIIKVNGLPEELQKSMEIPVSNNNLYRKVFTSTQTRKNRFERWQNVEGYFRTKTPQNSEANIFCSWMMWLPQAPPSKRAHTQLLKIENAKISIATLAFADI